MITEDGEIRFVNRNLDEALGAVLGVASDDRGALVDDVVDEIRRGTPRHVDVFDTYRQETCSKLRELAEMEGAEALGRIADALEEIA